MYYQQGDTLYAFYTVTFTEGPAEEPAVFSEVTSFSMPVVS